jgi:hypothetical protein
MVYDQAVQMGPTPYGMVPAFRSPDRPAAAATTAAHSIRTRLGLATARNVATVGQLSAMLSSDVLPSFGKTKMPLITTSTKTAILQYPAVGRVVWSMPTLATHWRVPRRIQGTRKPKAFRNRHATNTGAPLATAGGLVFIGGTSDGQFRAFDSMTGKELWSTSPGFDVSANAVSYKGANGKQYIVISGPKLIAYALP